MSELLTKKFVNHLGLDLKSSDLNRRDEFASGMKNAQYKKDGSPEKRPGFKGSARSLGGHGLGVYNLVNSSGVLVPELISVSDKLHKQTKSTLTVTYSGAEDLALINIFFDIPTDQYRCQVLEGVALVLDSALGLGFDEASPKTIDTLRGEIDALTDFVATVSGTTTVSAAFLDITRNFDLVAGPAAIVARDWIDVNTTVSAPFAGSETNKNNDDFENVSFAQLNNLLFISNGYDFLQKYDSQTVYRAGLPKPTTPTTALVVAGLLTGTYRHTLRFVQIDAVGNLVEGQPSDDSTPDLVPAAESIDVTITNILAGSGFNTNCAIVVGAQATINTITVDDGSGGSHTMQAGDTAYFFDSVTGDFVERNVDSVAATTITVAGAAVTVADNAVISNNLRIGIFRNLTGGTFKFLVAEIPNDSFTATQVFNDDVVDASLGIQLLQPIRQRDLPPKGKYITAINAQLAMVGQIDKPNDLNWSDIDGPEFWPPGNNQRLESNNSDPLSGLGQNGEVLVCFENRATHVASGDFTENNLRFDAITSDIGCSAHATITPLLGRIRFLSDRGVFDMLAGQRPFDASEEIEPVFDQVGVITADRFNAKKAVAINHRDEQKYILLLPIEQTDSGDKSVKQTSRIFANDYFRGAWLEWDNYNFSGGAVIFENTMFFSERRFSTFNSSVDHILFEQMLTGDSFDYQDNNIPVNFQYDTNWYHEGEPSIFKKYLRLKIFSIPETTNNDSTLTIDVEGNFQRDFTRGTATLDLGGSGEGYGVEPYGTEPYGSISEPGAKTKLPNKKFKAMRLRFKNNVGQQNVDITGWELDVATPFRREMKE